jgi:predicted regulator of Ras-like GTPase activity (Roadblock/LC7/MglB family)
MSQLDTALHTLRAHAGVEHVLVLGRDGLLIQHVGDGGLDAETVSAMVPGLAQAAHGLGGASGLGAAVTAVVQLAAGVAVVTVLSDELLLALLLRSGVGFAPLLRDLAEQRASLAALV